MILDIENSTITELEAEHEACMKDWGKYSCDCFGFYIKALQNEIYTKQALERTKG